MRGLSQAMWHMDLDILKQSNGHRRFFCVLKYGEIPGSYGGDYEITFF
jgi:hypothetical protein